MSSPVPPPRHAAAPDPAPVSGQHPGPGQPPGRRPERILVVDDDGDIARFIQLSLDMEGYEVAVAHNGAAALERVAHEQPDLVILDVMMPAPDGFEVTRILRADALTSALPIILLTARGQTTDKVLGLTEGADDYVVKPFDTLELLARVRSTLRRKQEFREVSPLTGLPGNTRILREIATRLRCPSPFAVCYCDIDGFKEVNDAYGFARGDEFIIALGRQLQHAVRHIADPSAFLGHVGGDDFVVICTPEQVMPMTEMAINGFEAATDHLYDPQDRERGHMVVQTRRHGICEVGLVTVSVGVALSTRRAYGDPRELIADASHMKAVAKDKFGSMVAIDRRQDP